MIINKGDNEQDTKFQSQRIEVGESIRDICPIDPENKVTKRKGRLTYFDRLKIEVLLEQGKPVSQIARILGYTRDGIYKEIKRGGTPYSAETAQKNVIPYQKIQKDCVK